MTGSSLVHSLRPTVAAALLPLLACVTMSQAARGHDHPPVRGRLVFGDHDAAVLRVLDLDTGEVSHAFDLPKPNPDLASAGDGRHVVVKTGDAAGTVRILDTGIVTESHGDHDHVEKLPPRLLDLALTGDKPAHVVSGAGRVAVFFDGDRPWLRRSAPKVVLIHLPVSGGTEPRVDTLASPAPQHGIAVPLDATRLLVSVPNPAYARGDDRTASSRPNGFRVLDTRGAPETWTAVASFDDPSDPDASCRLFHGHAASGPAHVFGCAEGIGGGLLVVEPRGDGWTGRKLPYPDGRRTAAIKGGGGRLLIGNYGSASLYRALLRIDPSAGSVSLSDVLTVPDGQPACQFELSGSGRRVANLTPDGRLRVYDLQPGWREVASFEAVPPFDCAFGAATPKPSLAVRGGSAFVSDPANGRIREYGLETLRQGLDLPVGGRPGNLAGGSSGG